MLAVRMALMAIMLPLVGCMERDASPEDAPGVYVGEYNSFVDTITLRPDGKYERKIASPEGIVNQSGEWTALLQGDQVNVVFSGWSGLCDRSANEVEPCPYNANLHAGVRLRRTWLISFHPQGLYLEVWRSDEAGQFFFKQPQSG